MINIARKLFVMVGCIFPILIGCLHTYVHFSDLVKPEVKDVLQSEIMIMGEKQIVWDTWGIMSLMMGISFIVIGLLNISIFMKLQKEEAPPWLAIISMFLYLISVTYVGYEYAQSFQLYGGIFGIVMLSICSIITFRKS